MAEIGCPIQWSVVSMNDPGKDFLFRIQGYIVNIDLAPVVDRKG